MLRVIITRFRATFSKQCMGNSTLWLLVIKMGISWTDALRALTEFSSALLTLVPCIQIRTSVLTSNQVLSKPFRDQIKRLDCTFFDMGAVFLLYVYTMSITMGSQSFSSIHSNKNYCWHVSILHILSASSFGDSLFWSPYIDHQFYHTAHLFLRLSLTAILVSHSLCSTKAVLGLLAISLAFSQVE